jgi:hypothetical protein
VSHFYSADMKAMSKWVWWGKKGFSPTKKGRRAGKDKNGGGAKLYP